MESNIQNSEDKYNIYNRYVTKNSLSDRKCCVKQSVAMFTIILLLAIFFLFFFVSEGIKLCTKYLSGSGKIQDECINI